MTIKICKHCNSEFNIADKPKGWMANHSRWCESNPKRIQYLEVAKNLNNLISPESRKQIRESLKVAHAAGKYSYKECGKWMRENGHSAETKEKIRKKALESNHRRLVKSTRKYLKKDGTEVLLDSSWEELLAKRLDELCVEWIRPNPIKWIDSKGTKRNYFPDFYLPGFQLYLDPKNPIAKLQQNEKVIWLSENRKDVIFLFSINEIKNFRL